MIRIEEMSVRLGIDGFAFKSSQCRAAIGRAADNARRHKKRARSRASSSPTRTRAQARRGARSLTQNRRRGKGRPGGAGAGTAEMRGTDGVAGPWQGREVWRPSLYCQLYAISTTYMRWAL